MIGPSLKIFKTGESILNSLAEKVTEDEFNSEKLIEIIENLKSISKELGAVGFAAPQLGYAKRVMITGMESPNPRRPNVKTFPNTIFINPEVTQSSSEHCEDWEGCASIDDILAYVSRPITIEYRARDPEGKFVSGKLEGFQARVFLHELDHLDGILMDERAIETKHRDTVKSTIISLKS